MEKHPGTLFDLIERHTSTDQDSREIAAAWMELDGLFEEVRRSKAGD